MQCNQVVIDGQLMELDALRHTPAGVAVVNFKFRHESEQTESGIRRKTECEVEALAFAGVANSVAQMSVGQRVRIKGFLAKKSYSSSKLVLHVNEIEMEKDNNHAAS